MRTALRLKLGVLGLVPASRGSVDAQECLEGEDGILGVKVKSPDFLRECT